MFEKLIFFGGFKNWNIKEIIFFEFFKDIWVEILDYSVVFIFDLFKNFYFFGGFVGIKIKNILLFE